MKLLGGPFWHDPEWDEMTEEEREKYKEARKKKWWYKWF